MGLTQKEIVEQRALCSSILGKNIIFYMMFFFKLTRRPDELTKKGVQISVLGISHSKRFFLELAFILTQRSLLGLGEHHFT